MRILVSPAKTLDFETQAPISTFTMPELIQQSSELMKVCRELSAVDIARLMKVSDKIAGLNVARFTEWQPEFTLENAKQAIFAFKGDVYTGLDAETLSSTEINQAQKNLRILSGLYGLLKPLDLMMAYRLEMGTALDNSRGRNLYQFWGEIITDKLNEDLNDDSVVVNLASNEYFKAVKTKQLDGQLITPIFKDCKAGEFKVISFYAKKARGMMARYIIQNNIETREQLVSFDVAGYYYSEQDSTFDTPVFLREELVK